MMAWCVALHALTHSVHGGGGGMGMPSDTRAVDMPSDGRARVRVGNRHLLVDTELVPMTDSTDLYKQGRDAELRARLDADGFLFVRDALPRDTVAAARDAMLRHLDAQGALRAGTPRANGDIEYKRAWHAKHHGGDATPGGALLPGWVVDAQTGGQPTRSDAPKSRKAAARDARDGDAATDAWRAVGNSRALTDVYDGAPLRAFYRRVLGAAATTLPECTWLRAKGGGEVTAEHADFFYFHKYTSLFADHYAPSAGGTAAQQAVLREQGARRAAQSDDAWTTCQACRRDTDAASTLLCDMCGAGFHVACLRPALAERPSTRSAEDGFVCYACADLPLDFWTCWIPLGDLQGVAGRLAVAPGTHKLGGYANARRSDLLPRAFDAAAPRVWHTPVHMRMGDVILFNIKTVHAATMNGVDRYRLSIDTRVTTCVRS